MTPSAAHVVHEPNENFIVLLRIQIDDDARYRLRVLSARLEKNFARVRAHEFDSCVLAFSAAEQKRRERMRHFERRRSERAARFVSEFLIAADPEFALMIRPPSAAEFSILIDRPFH